MKRSNFRAGVGALAIALTVAPMAAAQSSRQSEDQSPSDQAQTPEERTDGIPEIVVTAERREGRLQDTPVSITAITGDLADRMGIGDTEALIVATPGLEFGRGASNGGAPFIRGVGTPSAIAGNESPVAIYVDDVYIGVPAATLFKFNNIERVEVLKGPQGTLFGRNATAGVIQVRTRLPSRNSSLDAELGYANYDTITGALYANVGLGDTLAANLAFFGSSQRDGWGKSLTTGEDVQLGSFYGLRGKILWTPSSDTSVLLAADYAYERSDFGLDATIERGSIGLDGQTSNAGRYDTYNDPKDLRRLDQYGLSAKVDQEFSWLRLVSISAYRKTNLNVALDQDNTPAAISRNEFYAPTRAFSQEIQFLSNHSGPLTWIFGGYYLSQIARYDPLRVLGTSIAPNQFTDTRSRQHLQSLAAFGEAKVAVLPQTNFTLGVRYTRDRYDFELRRFANGNPTGTPQAASAAFPKWTYRAVLDHHLADDIMIYGSFSRGFKSGGYNITSGGNPVAPEVLDAYELGLKSELFDRKVRLNASAFYYDYSNLQVSIVNAGVTTTLNAAAARFKGFDIDLMIAPADGLLLIGGLAVLDGEYTDFRNGPTSVPRPGVCTPLPAQLPGPRTGGNMTCQSDLTGNDTVRTPPFTASMAANYSFRTDSGTFGVNISFYHNSGYSWDPDNRLKQPSYNLVNASLTWTDISEKYGIKIWANNLFDDQYFLYKVATNLRDSNSSAAPRTYGITFSVHY